MKPLQLRLLALLLYCYERWPGRSYPYREELRALRRRVRADLARGYRAHLWRRPPP